MSSEDQVVALFAKANPVPSLSMLDPVEPVDVGHLIHRSERSSEMLDVKTAETPERVSRRRRFAPALVLGLITFATLAILVGRPGPLASPIDVANAHMEARANLDTERALSLFAGDATVREEGFGLEEYSDLWAWYRSIGWEWEPDGCEQRSTSENGGLVRCTYQFENDMSRALDHPPVTGEVNMLVSEGRITQLVSYLDIRQFSDVWEAFLTFVSENHPNDVDTMYVPGGTNPRLDADSRALWADYVREFTAAQD